jgi:hypothetical protein
MAVKRTREDDDYEVSDIEYPCDKVTIHGMITALSPVKASKKNEERKYFNAKLSDGKKTMRVISFAPNLRDQIEKSHLTESPVALINCQVKETLPQYHRSDESKFEIVASSLSSVEESSHSFSEDFSFRAESATIELKQLADTSVNDHVTITVKVTLQKL